MYDNYTNGTTRSILRLSGSVSGSPYPKARTVPRLVGRSDRLRLAVRLGIGLALGGYAAFLSPVAEAVTPLAVTSCNPCNDLSHLQGQAQWFSVNVPQSAGTVIFVTSLSAPLTAFFKVNVTCSSGHCFRYVTALTPTTKAAGLLYATAIGTRMKGMLPITTSSPYNDSDDYFDNYLMHQLVYTGVSGSGPWGGIPSLPVETWYQVKDVQMGDTLYQIWPGDTITLNYPGGYSQKWQFKGVPTNGCPINGLCQWQPVPHTLMKDGVIQNPPLPPPPPAKPLPNWGIMKGESTWPPASVVTEADLTMCSGTSSITITAPDGSTVTSYGYYTFPC